ncbi:hypothetical protein HanRHA438_Chr12g0570411 [Helianthus annuus]|nr:hypothetical protein HanRHA438_Chr12g0570411 [Helianthus annuus]
MGYGAGVVAWVGYKCPIHHPGWVGFRRGPLGRGFSPGVERGYQDDIAGSHWPRQPFANGYVFKKNLGNIRICGMGRRLCRGLGTNAQVTTPGELRFRRGPLGGGFSPGVGRGYQNDMVGSHWPRQVAVWASRLPTAMCLKKDLGNIRI